jgi:hypothetical protein
MSAVSKDSKSEQFDDADHSAYDNSRCTAGGIPGRSILRPESCIGGIAAGHDREQKEELPLA